MRAAVYVTLPSYSSFYVGSLQTSKITEELAAMQSVKGTGSDFFTKLNACLEKLGLKWDKLIGVTTDG